jgi:hypothetical protein
VPLTPCGPGGLWTGVSRGQLGYRAATGAMTVPAPIIVPTGELLGSPELVRLTVLSFGGAPIQVKVPAFRIKTNNPGLIQVLSLTESRQSPHQRGPLGEITEKILPAGPWGAGLRCGLGTDLALRPWQTYPSLGLRPWAPRGYR